METGKEDEDGKEGIYNEKHDCFAFSGFFTTLFVH